MNDERYLDILRFFQRCGIQTGDIQIFEDESVALTGSSMFNLSGRKIQKLFHGTALGINSI